VAPRISCSRAVEALHPEVKSQVRKALVALRHRLAHHEAWLVQSAEHVREDLARWRRANAPR
jgi:hypothetical protein